MKTFNKILDNIEEIGGVISLTAMFIVVLINVFMRYVVKLPFTIGEELARYLMIWATYIGVSMGVRRRAHLGVTAFVDRFPVKAQKPVSIIADLVTLGVFIALLVVSIQFILLTKTTGQTTPAMKIPFYIIYSVLPIGFAFSAVRVIQNMIYDYIIKENTEDRYEEVNL